MDDDDDSSPEKDIMESGAVGWEVLLLWSCGKCCEHCDVSPLFRPDIILRLSCYRRFGCLVFYFDMPKF